VQNSRTARHLLCALIVALAPTFPQQAAAIGTVEVDGSAGLSGYTSFEEARNRALGDARQRAVAVVAGTSLSSETVVAAVKRSGVKLFTQTRARTTGRIVKEEILGWHVEQIPTARDKPPYLVLRVKIRADIEAETPKESGFAVSLDLGQVRTAEGAPISVKVRSSERAHLYLFNLDSEGKVRALYPNAAKPELIITPRQPIVLPDPDEGVQMKPSLPKGQRAAIEALKVVAAKRPLRLPEMSKAPEGMELAQFNDWLCSIPLELRAEDTKELVVFSTREPDSIELDR